MSAQDTNQTTESTEDIERPKMFIGGPATGYDHANKDAFEFAATKLEELNYEAVYSKDEELHRKDYRQALTQSMKDLLECSSAFFLSGWETSKGATVQHQVATALGMDIYHEDQSGWER